MRLSEGRLLKEVMRWRGLHMQALSGVSMNEVTHIEVHGMEGS